MSELHDMSMTGSYLAKIEQLKRELAEAKRDAGYDQRNAAMSQAESAKLLRELAEMKQLTATEPIDLIHIGEQLDHANEQFEQIFARLERLEKP